MRCCVASADFYTRLKTPLWCRLLFWPFHSFFLSFLFFSLLLSFFNVAAVPRPKVGGVEKRFWSRGPSLAGAFLLLLLFLFFFYAPSLKGCKRMCFLWSQLPPICKKVHSVPYLTAKHGASGSGRRAAAREGVQDACCVAPKWVYKRRRASRLAFKSFERGPSISRITLDFLLQCGRLIGCVGN